MTRTGLICALAAAGWLIGPVAQAPAGTYRAAQCHAKFGVGPADIDFRRTSTHYQSDAACGAGSTGLAVTHKASHTNSGRWGAWTAMAPAGTRFVRASAMVSGRRRAGHVPELLVGPMEALVPFGTATGGFHRITWRGAGVRGVRAALRCDARGKCGPGSEARVRVRRLMLTLVDSSPPRVTAAGSLFAGGARRASEQIGVSAHDAGSGVHRVFVQVNGEPVVANTLDCALKGHVALRLSPCPAHATPQFAASTAQPPFRQGPNRVRVCATDYAPDTGSSRDCAARRVRVDNACPLSGVAAGTHIRAHLRKGKRPLRFPGRAKLAGRLLDSAGDGVAGAEVCVGTRTDVAGAPERIVGTPTTGPSGRFALRIPRGPNRMVRVAHWPSPSVAAESFRSLRVRARPRLTLQPGGVLENGERVRFRAELPGPRAAGRHVALKVRANGRWLPLRRGGTNKHGVWTGAYRFQATTGRQTYRFAAFAPKQRGYPYQAGRSKTRRQTVVG